jgi:gamma-glutamylcyclotransferase (GGCT)/AIG2-like uncharacterized protein YtfP
VTGPSSLFVYGTLMPGRLRWPLLEPYAIAHRPADVPGTIYDSGRGWPVAKFFATTDTAKLFATTDTAKFFAPAAACVPGVLVEVDPLSLAECLEIIDEVEDTATDLLRRVVVTTTVGARAWAYHYPHVTAGFVPISRWDVDPAHER